MQELTAYMLMLLCAMTMTVTTVAAQTSGDVYYCYSGSSLYQLDLQNCGDEDPSYTGDWFCGVMKVCETYQPSGRECITTRGCAKREQCTDSSGGIFDGSTPNGTVAGAVLYPSCCQANSFPTDDAIAIDYSNVCNAASASGHAAMISMTVGMVAAVTAVAVGVAGGVVW